MKKSIFILIFGLFFCFTLLNSCSSYIDVPSDVEGHYELTSIEIWGVEPQENAVYKPFGSFPFDLTYTWGIDTYTYYGFEGNVTRSEYWGLGKETKSINFSWSEIPEIIYPDTDYTITWESKGNIGNGISVSKPVLYDNAFSWLPGSFRNGSKSGTIRMSVPDSNTKQLKSKIGVNLSSGQSYYMEWWYIYEWVE